MKNLRTHGKSTVVWLLMGLLILGLGGFGVTSFSGGSSEVGAVGETKVTADEYARALQSQINEYSRQTGQPLSMAQAETIGLPQAVQAQLFTGAALEEQARKIGVSVGDERVRQSILDAQAFQGPTGKFDRTAYREVLNRQQMTEAEFESTIRSDEARLLIQRAVIGGVVPPSPMVDLTTEWLLGTRDMAWVELTEDQLPSAPAAPDDETLTAWHEANADQFTSPEARKISYVWLTPEMLADDVQLDEQALRDAYDAEIEKYVQPERRLVSRLVFPSVDSARDAMASIEAGDASFEDYVTQRGLTTDDVDLGEVSEAELDAAGADIFALSEAGVVGPIDTALGPALFAMHAILEPVQVPFEEAREELRAEAAVDRAARMIDDRSSEFEDLLAGGATLEDMAGETAMELGQVDWIDDNAAEATGILGYEAFREMAATVAMDDFPELFQLDDGGVFALRLDEIIPPALIPFDEVRDEVEADWRAAEVHRQLLSLAEEKKVKITAAADPTPVPTAVTAPVSRIGMPDDAADDEETTTIAPAAPQLAWNTQSDIRRDGWIEQAPADILEHAFSMKEIGAVDIVDAQQRVFLVRLDAIHQADLEQEEALQVKEAVGARLGQSLQADLFDYYARAAQQNGGLRVDQAALSAINAQVH
ncbi:SurA N-terminal domain-containing protein [Paracoccus sp. Z330]|uniref:SurA N-terminal domain-containing protein n=1 Tax=Paracoccus onchidii TaxID=3017813 RepID=A0ABT4ZJ81_9RHOB|nr:peptidylprolyl isomerase [Paracoccus onchidii]MDB6179424.1 SurA N-terminal domain-containing protein [Paracoccus onchidii]